MKMEIDYEYNKMTAGHVSNIKGSDSCSNAVYTVVRLVLVYEKVTGKLEGNLTGYNLTKKNAHELIFSFQFTKILVIVVVL